MTRERLRAFSAAAGEQLRGPWSLRRRLLAAVVVLSLSALIVVGAATYFSLGSYLQKNFDKQLLRTALSGQRLGGFGDRAPDPDTAVTLYSLTGTLEQAVTGATLPRARPTDVGDRAYTVTGSDGHRYRVVALQAVSAGTIVGTVVYGLPASRVDNVLHRLLLLEIAVSAGAVVLLGCVGSLLVRVGLRPLGRIGDTAGAIAAGDLSQRVESTNPRTEVGRLGLSLNAMLAQIEDEVTQRTASEDRLRRFIADASHELRTPLTSIRGYAELFRRGAADRPADLAMAMRRIEAESGRMGGLVDDLLLLARLDGGRPLELVPVDLATLAADSATDARALAPDRSVEVTVDGDTIVLADDARLRQVLANLVRNVLAHTPAGSPFGIRVRGGPASVVVEVWDTGPGLSPEDASRAFDRFWRSDPSRQREHSLSGAGLGLSIVEALTAAHGGAVTLIDTPGGGATFRVVLPREPTPESPLA